MTTFQLSSSKGQETTSATADCSERTDIDGTVCTANVYESRTYFKVYEPRNFREVGYPRPFQCGVTGETISYRLRRVVSFPVKFR